MKKSIVVFYSQAGSTQKVAKAIQRGIKRKTGQCDIVKLKEIKPEDLKKYQLIGLGSPGWHSRPADPMQIFMENLPADNSKHYFFFCTHGSMPGPLVRETVAMLRKKGLTVIGGEDWYGSVFLPYMPKPFFTDGHPDDIDLQEAEKFGEEMAERSSRIFSGEIGLIPDEILGKGFLQDAYVYDYEDTPAMRKELFESRSRPFKINEEKCTRCLLCVENCPSHTIDSSGPFPVFKTIECARCWYCEQICPTGAIEYDWEAVTRAMAKYDGTTKIEKELDIAESKGYFRRLVPLKDVGKNTQWHKVSKHPRLKVP